MRLIDADRLKDFEMDVSPSERYPHMVVNSCAIDRAPTVLEIPDNATNGEVIEALFPNATFKDAFIDTFAEITFVGSGYALLKKEWLGSPYKRGDK